MSQFFVEGDLEIKLPSDWIAKKLDEKGEKFTGADLFIEISDCYMLVQVKDYDGPRIAGATNDPTKSINNFQLAWEKLLPNLYRSFIRLFHLDRYPEKRVVFVCLIGYENLDNALRSKLTNDLRDVVERIGPIVGDKKVPPTIQVLTVAQWNSEYPHLPVVRLSTKPSNQ